MTKHIRLFHSALFASLLVAQPANAADEADLIRARASQTSANSEFANAQANFRRADTELYRAQTDRAVKSVEADKLRVEINKEKVELGKKQADAFYYKKQLHTSYRASKIEPQLSRDVLESVAKTALPERLVSHASTKSQVTIDWPFILTNERFDDGRLQLESLFAERTIQKSGLGTRNHIEIRRVTSQMLQSLKGLVAEVPSDEYLLAKKYLQSLAFEARFANEPAQEKPSNSSSHDKLVGR